MRWYRIPRGYTTTAHGYTLTVEKCHDGYWWWRVKNTAGVLKAGYCRLFKDAKFDAIAAGKEISKR